MDSLLASYASSDEEEEESPNPSLPFSLPPPKSSLFSSLPPPNSPQTLTLISPPNPQIQSQDQILDKPTSLFSSLPKPKSSISQFSLPPPKSNPTLISPPNPNFQTQDQNLDKPTTLFSSLPQPKSSSSQFSLLPPSNAKKIVQVKLPVIKPSKFDDDDEEDDVKEREERKIKSFVQSTSALSFLSSLPCAKNSSSTLGALPSALGSGRRSIVETNLPSSNSTSFSTEAQVGVGSNEANYDGSSINSEYGVSGSGGGNYESYDGNAGYGNYDYYQQYNNNWGDGSAEVAQSSLGGVGESVMKVPGKRGRNEIPTNIVEVKQDELIKNRPREDQVKSTGIAFGPAYQPVSTKGKPSKLQKRKHQIGSLYFDMRQKESELAERRSKGFLTKAETQAKYGW